MKIRFIFVFFIGLLTALFFNNTEADPKGDWIVKQSGVECRLPVIQPWQKLPAFFGFGAMLYQESKKDEEKRATFSLLITPFKADGLTPENLDEEIKAFHDGKKEFVEEELGGTYLGPGPSLKGEGDKKLYRASVNYELEEIQYRDSTYFRFVNGNMIHAKVVFPLEAFDDSTVEQQITELLAGLSCQK